MFKLTAVDLAGNNDKPFWHHVVVDGEPVYQDEKPVRVKIASVEDEALELAAYKEYKKLRSLQSEAIEAVSGDEESSDEKEFELIKKHKKLGEIQAEFASKVIVDWEGFLDEKGKQLKCTPSHVYVMYKKFPELAADLKRAIAEKKGITIE